MVAKPYIHLLDYIEAAMNLLNFKVDSRTDQSNTYWFSGFTSSPRDALAFLESLETLAEPTNASG